MLAGRAFRAATAAVETNNSEHSLSLAIAILDYAKPLAHRRLYEIELLADLVKGSQRLVEIVLGVGRRNLAPHPGMALRNHGVPEPGHEYPFGQIGRAHV